MNKNLEKEKSNVSFWQLITKCKIRIPQLQRDYAQGRKDESIRQIRETLIEEFYDAIDSGTQLVLNFIYGDKKKDIFTPIDGQQRLTTLFLFHWYIFKRSNFDEGISELKKFSYMTRDTSKRFCERICDTDIDFDNEHLYEQITNCYWFSGNFDADPTIQSMMVVIESIHRRFKNHTDFYSIRDKLVDDECPIIFLWLSMDDFKNTNDLYIKMNARGKLLSDFEIFKAKLQNSNYIKEIIGNNATGENKILFISKYNNEYAELFYKYYQNQYDDAMMAFIITGVRDDYFSYASEYAVPQKEYRNAYKTLANMNGSIFYRFIESGGMGYEKIKDAEKIIVNALKKCDKLLEIYVSKMKLTVPTIIQKKYYDETNLFKTNSLELTFEKTVVRYALYEYIYRIGFPKTNSQSEAYNYWKRYVYNIVENTDFAGRVEDICAAMAFFRKMVESLVSDTKNDISKEDILVCIKCTKKPTAEMRYQHKEEQIKAELMIDEEWNTMILDAEEYFVDGQIGFVLSFSKESSGKYNKELFKNNMLVAKRIFNNEKKLNVNVDTSLFERTLLCMPDFTENATAHLLKQSNSTTTWGFYKEDYRKLLSNKNDGEKRNFVKALFEKISGYNDINEGLQDIISKVDINKFNGKNSWKLRFIQNDLFDISLGRTRFNNCIHLAKNNTELLLLVGTTVRSYSMELNTLLLAKKLRENNIKEPSFRLHMETTGDIVDNSNNFPLRYIECKGTKTAYMNDNDKVHPFVHMNRDGKCERVSFDKAYELLKDMK